MTTITRKLGDKHQDALNEMGKLLARLQERGIKAEQNGSVMQIENAPLTTVFSTDEIAKLSEIVEDRGSNVGYLPADATLRDLVQEINYVRIDSVL